MAEIKINKIIRSKRKTISLVITQDAELVIRAPMYVTLDYLENLVSKKSSWIKKNKEIVIKRNKESPPKEFVNGELFYYLGKAYRLRLSEDGTQDIELNDSLVMPKILLSDAKEYLIQWYKEQALCKITNRVEYFSGLTSLKYKAIKISSAEERLGSCGYKGTLNFSWRLIMAPLRIVDYVVVHELSHLEHRNHSLKFWDKVRAILPDYEQRKKWLKINGHLLRI